MKLIVPLLLIGFVTPMTGRSQSATVPQVTAISIGPAGANDARTTPDRVWRVADFAADCDGVIWGIAAPVVMEGSSSVSADSIKQLAIFDTNARAWRMDVCEPARDGAARRLATLTDGSVACLWQSGEQTIITKHRAGKSSAWAEVRNAFQEPRICPIQGGGLIITETGPKIARVLSDGSDPVVRTIEDELLSRPEKSDDGSRNHAAVRAVQVGDGSVWLWCYALQPLNYLWRINGFLRWEGNSLSQVRNLPFQEKSVISAVIADGSAHLFAAEAGAALWRVALDGGKHSRIAAPGDAFSYIEHLVFIAGCLHIVTCPRPDEISVQMSTTVKNHLELRTVRHYDNSKPTGSVFRIKGNALEPVVSGLDDEPGFGRSPRSMVEGNNGLMIGSVKGGPWWLSSDPGGKPVRLGREHGHFLRDAAAVLPTRGAGWLVRSFDTTWELIDPTRKLAAVVESRVSMLKTLTAMVQDARHDLWAFRAVEKDFAKWADGKWLEQEAPPVARAGCLDLSSDAHEQAWLISANNGKSAVLDMRIGRWSLFDTPESAIQQRLAKGDRVQIPRYLVFGPIAHSSGTKGFLAWDGIVHVFMNGRWTRTPLTDIAGPNAVASGCPFFDSHGRFCMPVEFRHFQLRADGKWVEMPNANTDHDRTYERDEDKPPPESNVPNVTSTAIDRHGVAWMTQHDGTVWKWLAGAAVKVTDAGNNPLLPPHTRIEKALVDDRGHAFLRQTGGSDPCIYCVVAPTIRPADALATVDTGADESPRINFNAVRGTWHRLRVNEGPWGPATRETAVVLSDLLPGKHRVEVQSYDAELIPLGSAQTLTVQRNAANAAALRALIASFRSEDLEERERAAKALQVQGSSALPELREALKESAPESNLQWWLRATIQRIERREGR